MFESADDQTSQSKLTEYNSNEHKICGLNYRHMFVVSQRAQQKRLEAIKFVFLKSGHRDKQDFCIIGGRGERETLTKNPMRGY